MSEITPFHFEGKRVRVVEDGSTKLLGGTTWRMPGALVKREIERWYRRQANR